MIRAVAVVVPAHDEVRLLGPCLESVRRAAAHPRLRGVPVRVVVAADACRDGTAVLARAHGAAVVETAVHSAGRARALGTARALAVLLSRTGGPAERQTWLAHTDADTRVPACWLAHHLEAAAAGFHAVAGTVEVDDWAGHLPATALRFRRLYEAHRAAPGAAGGVPGQGHPHVHGANLAVRADAYLRAGGFPSAAVGEDHALTAALEAAGYRIRRTEECPVRTSARRTPRARGGFGDLLLGLEAEARGPRRAAAGDGPPPGPARTPCSHPA
ncbi:glycosyltransferase [Streptomyces sp. NPDC001380]|uniref:glycosyltransferase n=1 Tax=Streptomyces sp. NPDC001380 TaxID=3364566 RepID=UPI00369072C0